MINMSQCEAKKEQYEDSLLQLEKAGKLIIASLNAYQYSTFICKKAAISLKKP